jgi:hypothetical protein
MRAECFSYGVDAFHLDPTRMLRASEMCMDMRGNELFFSFEAARILRAWEKQGWRDSRVCFGLAHFCVSCWIACMEEQLNRLLLLRLL